MEIQRENGESGEREKIPEERERAHRMRGGEEREIRKCRRREKDRKEKRWAHKIFGDRESIGHEFKNSKNSLLMFSTRQIFKLVLSL